MPSPVNAGRARARALALVAGGLLAGPVLLAFWSGGFFDDARLWALAGAGALVLVCALTAPLPLPRGRGAAGALGALALFVAWTWLSTGWSPLHDAARDDLERLLLYLAFVVAGVAAWRGRPAARAAEVGVAAGALVVTLYGLAGRLMPWLIDLSASVSAGGRLEQPLTYWNAQGALAALGVVLCARIAGDRTRGTGLRMVAAAAVSPLLIGVYISFSRGAVLALACGVLVLLACAPTWTQLRALAIGFEAAGVAVIAAALSPGVRALEGSDGARDAEGAIVLAVLVACMGAAAALTAIAARAEAEERLRLGRLALPRRGVGPFVAGVCAVAIVVPVLMAGTSTREPAFGATTQRFADLGSNRARYWDVALATFADHPLAGAGTAAYRVEWLRRRDVPDVIRDAHSLPLETAAELGLVGLLLLLGFAAGIARCARTLQRTDPALAAGVCAGLTTWAVHAGVDWDWELPAVTLPALTLAAVALARADHGDGRAAPG